MAPPRPVEGAPAEASLSRGRAGVVRITGLVVLAVAVVELARIASWLERDLTPAGHRRPTDGVASSVAVLGALASLLVAVVLLVAHRRLARGRRPRIVLAIGALAVVAALVAGASYPQVVHARVVAVDPVTGAELWRTPVPGPSATVVKIGKGTLTVELYSDSGCDWEPHAVELDRATGEILGDVDAGAVPWPTADIGRAHGLRVDQGSDTNECSS